MKRKIPLIGLCILFAGMSVYYGIGLYRAWSEYRAGEQAYEELTQYVHLEIPPTPTEQIPEEAAGSLREETSPSEPEPTEETDDTVWPVVDFAALQAINADVMAWICIEGTDVNYPVAQGWDNQYYLKRLLDGTYNSAGTIFVDYRNDPELTDRNTILYGHHLKRGTMFSQIVKYKEQAFYDQYPTGMLITPDKNYTIEFFAGYVTDLNDDAWKIEFESDEEFSLWVEDTISKSIFTGTVKPSPQDRVVTLSTCSYEFNDARFVLLGILKER